MTTKLESPAGHETRRGGTWLRAGLGGPANAVGQVVSAAINPKASGQRSIELDYPAEAPRFLSVQATVPVR
jgi:hypothetical protein